MVKTFGPFEFDDRRRALTAAGQPVRLAGQAVEVLSLLLDRPGELITRDEIQRRLWPDSTVEFDHSLDVVVSRLRTVLDDRGPTPRYIQTVPRKGYRFVERVTPAADRLQPNATQRWGRQFHEAYEVDRSVRCRGGVLTAHRRGAPEPACAEKNPFVKYWSIDGATMGFSKPHAGEAAPLA